MHNNSNMRNKQTEIKAWKFLPFFKILQNQAWKKYPFFISRIRASHWKNTSFLCENGYEHGIYALVGSAEPGWILNELRRNVGSGDWWVFLPDFKTIDSSYHADSFLCNYHDVMKWKHFPRYWQFVRRIHRSPVNSPHKGQWRGALIFSLFYVWINGSVNNREAGDLRRHRAHYDAIVMPTCFQNHWQFLPCWLFSV